MRNTDTLHESVRQYYGEVLRGSADLRTDACCTPGAVPEYLKPLLADIHPEVSGRYYGCGLVAPDLLEGLRVLDLGCGPGLYATRLARLGLQVTGVDFSQNSIDYAVEAARQAGLEIAYRCQDYLTLTDETCYDAVLLIYGDFCPLSPQQRARLLANVRQALKPGGHFVLDVSTPALRQRARLRHGCHFSRGGFWKPGLHLVLEQGFAYDEDISLDQYTVFEVGGKISVYRNWFQDYTPASIRAELEAGGFEVESLWGDLTGTAYHPGSDWIGVVARKPCP